MNASLAASIDAMGTNGLAIGIIGLGAVGSEVCRSLSRGIAGIQLVAIAASSKESAAATARKIGSMTKIVDASEIAAVCDVVVDCAVPAALGPIAFSTFAKGKILLTINSNAIVLTPNILQMAKSTNGRLIVASGGIAGLDAIRAACEGSISDVAVITRKPPVALSSSLVSRLGGAELTDITRSELIFSGSARQCAEIFPSNSNVAASVALAGIGPERTRVEIWADPAIEHNIHVVQLRSDTTRLDLTIENAPSANPGTAKIVPHSVLAALKDLQGSVRIGS